MAYNDLLDLWSKWIRGYLDDFTGARLIIRYEDMLFNPEHTARMICHCVGGVLAKPFTEGNDQAKGRGRNRGEAKQRYSNATSRIHSTDGSRPYKMSDIKYIREHRAASELMRKFHYKLDP